jgi:mannose-6-phosphate isomerase-like protein (cupin superfamily)
MKNRRTFIQLSSLGLLSPFMSAVPITSLNMDANSRGIVSQPEDGETYFVRENTPLTIQVSKMRDSAETVSICREEIQPGNYIPVHKHLYADEFFIFQNGIGTIEIDGEAFPVKAGTCGFVPRATWHCIHNPGSDLLIFSFGYSPAGFEDFFRQIGTPKGIPFKAKTPGEISTIAGKYGMVYKG